MREYKQRRSFKRILYSPLAIFGLVVLFFFIAHGAWSTYQSERMSRQGLANVAAQYKDLSNRQAFLQNEVDKLSTGRGLEEELRTKFPVAKDGEKVVIIVEPQTGSVATTTSKTWWQRIIGFFR